jgi:peptidoglycan/xylan/chitin deacetylase (PgdA/CDA1 family)
MIPILTFHALEDTTALIAFSPGLFRNLMIKLYDAGYRSFALMDAVRSIAGKRPFPERSFVITFDDGYESVYQHAFPVLQRLGFMATVFLTVDQHGERTDEQHLASLEQRRMLSWGQIREMERGGINFGAHTLTHPDLTRLPAEHARQEIIASKEIIQDALGKPVHSFAYPYGRYDEQSRRIVKEHFACACSDRLAVTTSASDLFALERVDAYYLRGPLSCRLMPTPLFDAYIKLRNVPRRIRRACQVR